MGAFALAVLILLSIATPVLADTNFKFNSETVIPEGNLITGGRVSAELVLKETTPSLTGATRLELRTELENPVWNIIMNDEAPETYTRSKFSFVFEHEDYDTVTIQLSGNAPAVAVKTEKVLIEVTQTAPPPLSTIYTITRYVTSGQIDEAQEAKDRAWNKIVEAEKTIADASDAGADVTQAEEYLQTAKIYFNNSNEFYVRGAMNESIAAADNAYDSAVRAYDSARGASGHQVLTSRVIYAGIIIAILIIAVVVYQKRRWERL